MDPLSLALARQMVAERQSNYIRGVEQRRVRARRAVARPQRVAAAPPEAAAHHSLPAWLTAHLHLALHRPAAH